MLLEEVNATINAKKKRINKNSNLKGSKTLYKE